MDIDLRGTLNAAILDGLTAIGLPDTTHNRIEMLNGMHKAFCEAEPIDAFRNDYLLAIENEVARLQAVTD